MGLLRTYFSWNGTAGRGKYFFGCIGAFVVSALISFLLLTIEPYGFLFFFFSPVVFLLISSPVLLILTKQRLKTLGFSSSLLFIFPLSLIAALVHRTIAVFGISIYSIPNSVLEMTIVPFIYLSLLTLFPSKPTNILGELLGKFFERLREFLSASKPLSLAPFRKRALPSLFLLYLLGYTPSFFHNHFGLKFPYNLYCVSAITLPVYIFLIITTSRRLSTLNLPIWMIFFFPFSYGLVANFAHRYSLYLDPERLTHWPYMLALIFFFIITVAFFYTISLLLFKKCQNEENLREVK